MQQAMVLPRFLIQQRSCLMVKMHTGKAETSIDQQSLLTSINAYVASLFTVTSKANVVFTDEDANS